MSKPLCDNIRIKSSLGFLCMLVQPDDLLLQYGKSISLVHIFCVKSFCQCCLLKLEYKKSLMSILKVNICCLEFFVLIRHLINLSFKLWINLSAQFAHKLWQECSFWDYLTYSVGQTKHCNFLQVELVRSSYTNKQFKWLSLEISSQFHNANISFHFITILQNVIYLYSSNTQW